MSSISKQLACLSSFTTKGKKEPSSSVEARLVLLGKTGSGKSSTGNSILGRKAFETKVSSSSATQRCRRACGEFRGRYLTLLDTPGLLDTHQPPPEVHNELKRSVPMLFPGPHAFLIVVQVGRFTEEEKEAVCQIQRIFGPHVLAFSLVVFTHGDSLEEGVSVRDSLIEGSEFLAELVAKCGGRYYVFNNHTSKNKEQVSGLLALVDAMLETNGGRCYTHAMLKEAEEEVGRVKEENTRQLREKEELAKKEQEKVVRQWYHGQLKDLELQSETALEEMRRMQKLNRERTEKLVLEKEEALRLERETHEKREKERKLHEVMQMMALRMEEEKKREDLREKLDNVNKTLQEQIEREKSTRSHMEEMIQKEKVANEKRERERELQQLQREQAIRRREELKREPLQNEHDRLAHALEEQKIREEEREKQREELIKIEREESQRKMESEVENLNAEKKQNSALQRQLWLITMKLKEHEAHEEKLMREKGDRMLSDNGSATVCDLNNHSDNSCSDMCDKAIVKKPIKEHNSLHTLVRPMCGYAHEMGLVVLNVALESIGSPCSIQ